MTNEASIQQAKRRRALSSPLRLELVGLFGGEKELSVSDMASRIGRPATSLYHHLSLLEDAEIVMAAGTRPKGKRFETVYRLSASVFELALDREDENARKDITRTIATAFRGAERDFAAAMERDDLSTDGGKRNLYAVRTHMRVTPDFLAKLNKRIDAIHELLTEYGTCPDVPGPNDQLVSLTMALLPLRGRRVEPEATPSSGEEE